MKSVLISIRPKYCELIVNGEKTIEVRKSRPKLDTPFKCYIYMSQGDLKDLGLYSEWIYKNRMKVIGEFVCDEIIKDERGENADLFTKKACLSLEKQKDYGKNKPLYGWHISDLKIYDNPKELSEFKRWNRTEENAPCAHTKWLYPDCKDCNACNLTRPPQSWQYVEELCKAQN